MNSPLRSYITPVCLALLLHGALGWLVAGAWFDNNGTHRVETIRHIKAELVDLRPQREAEAESKRKADAKRKAEEETARLRKLEQQRKAKQQAEQKRKADEARKRKQESERKAAAEKSRHQQENARKTQEAADKALRLKQAEEKRQAEEQAKQRKAREAAEKLAEAQRAAEKRAQEEVARAEREMEAEMRRIESQQQAQQAAIAEAERAESEREVVASVVSVIRDGVQRHWRRPPSARNGMKVEVRIHLLPTGEVDDAYVVRSSGDDAFDRSAVNAVLKAERFPELQGVDPGLFDRKLRRINLEFRPEDLRL